MFTKKTSGLSLKSKPHHSPSCHSLGAIPVNKNECEEWAAALERLNAPSADAMTLADWAKKLQCSRDKASTWIRKGLEQGWMERATTTVEELTGRARRAVGFRLTDKAKGLKNAKIRS